MNRNFENHASSHSGDWITSTVRRNPEALLLLAAGAALLMRSSSGWNSAGARRRHDELNRGYRPGSAGSASGESFRAESSRAESSRAMGEGLSHAAQTAAGYASDIKRTASDYASDVGKAASDMGKTAADYASDIKNRVSSTAGAYAESVSQLAGEAGRNISEQSQRFARQTQSTAQDTMNRVLRDQPLAVAVAGLAAGAAIAAAFPKTEFEDRALGGAREALTDAAGKAGENLMSAAGKAGERLKDTAGEHGLTASGLKDMARDVTDTFKSAVTGKSESHSEATIAPKSFQSGVGSGSTDQARSPTGTGTQPTGRGNR